MTRAQVAPAGLSDTLPMRIGGWDQPPRPLTMPDRIVLAACRDRLAPEQREHFLALCQDLTDQEWQEVSNVAQRHNLRSLVWYHLAREGFEPLVAPNIWEIMRTAYQEALLRQMRLVYTLREALATCHAAGIRAMPSKGPMLGMRIYGLLGPRPSRDLDIFIDVNVSQRRVYHVLQPLFDKWEARDIRVELAWALIHRPAYRATFDPVAIWDCAIPTTFRGTSCYAMHPNDELRYLCAHHIVHHEGSEWLWLVDIAEMMRRHEHNPKWNWQAFTKEVIATETALPVVLAFWQARTLLDAPVPQIVIDQLAEAAQTAPEQARWAAVGIDMPSIKGAAYLLRSAHSVGELGAIARTLVWPDRTYLREYHHWEPGQRATAVRLRRLQHIARTVLPGPAK